MTPRVTPFTVRPYGEIDLYTAPGLRHELTRALADHRTVVLDLSQVTFMDCSGLRVLLDARAQADRGGRCLVLHGIGRPVARLLELTGLSRRLVPRAPDGNGQGPNRA